MKGDIKERVELWLEELGYILDNELYSNLLNIVNRTNPYKAITTTVLKSLEKHNKDIKLNEAMKYAKNFANGMKSNLIVNNKYFQEVFEKGLFYPSTNINNKDISLYNIHEVQKNEYNYFTNILIKNGNHKRMFDFLVTINGFPLILIEVIDTKKESFKNAIYRLEKYFDQFPNLFYFNKIVILTDGSNYSLGSIYNLAEEFIDFSSSKKKNKRKGVYRINQLEGILSVDNILKILQINGKCINDYIKGNLNRKFILKKKIKKKEYVEYKSSNEKKTIDLEKHTEENIEEELGFLVELFNPDLDAIIESGNFKQKLKQLKEVPDFKENRAYIEDIQKTKDKETLEVFTKANRRLVHKVVNMYLGYQTSSFDQNDMYQFGCIGLLEALKRFDLDKNYEFSTYAVHWIHQAISRGIKNESLAVRIPVHRWESVNKLSKLERESEVKFNKVDYDWIRKKANMSEEKINELIIIRNKFMNRISLDSPVGTDSDTTIVDFIEDEDNNIEENILNKDLKDRLKEALEVLDAKSRDVIIKRFGLNGEKRMTLEEVGKLHGVTRERIRQIEKRALEKLRTKTIAKKYKDYCEGWE